MKYIIGVGNYSMYDDSIALRIIEYLTENNMTNGFEAVDLSANALNLFSYLKEDTEKILVIDTAKMGKVPGEYMFFNHEHAKTLKELPNYSTHEGDILQTIDLAKGMGYYIPEIRFMGIEPLEIKMEFGLSGILKKRFNEYIELAISELGS